MIHPGTYYVSPPNGCVRCGELERGHGQRFDGLHTEDANRGYVAPSDWLRKHRMTLVRVGRTEDHVLIVKTGGWA